LKEKPIIFRQLENELRSIRQLTETKENPVKKTKMLNVYGQMSGALIGKEIKPLRTYMHPDVHEHSQCHKIKQNRKS